MANQIFVEVAGFPGAQLIVIGEAVARFAYVDGKRTDKPVTGDGGRPVWAYPATLVLSNQSGSQARLEVESVDKPAAIPPGLLPLPKSAKVHVQLPQQGGRDLVVKVVIGDVTELTAGHVAPSAVKVA